MYSSNQILEISGDLNSGVSSLEGDLEFALKKYGGNGDYVFQITEDGRYCIGWGEAKGWEKYQFKFDIEVVSRIIRNFLKDQDIKRDIWGGGYDKGYLIKVIPESMSDEKDGIKNPFYGIISVEPHTCFYSK